MMPSKSVFRKKQSVVYFMKVWLKKNYFLTNAKIFFIDMGHYIKLIDFWDSWAICGALAKAA